MISWPLWTIPLERLSLFAGNLATCVSSGVDLPRALRANARLVLRGPLAGLIEEVVERVEAGEELSGALRLAEPFFPTFFLPVLQCGENAGRLEETLRYLESHCGLLAEPARKLRNTWLVPLAVLVAGWVLELLVRFAMLSLLAALGFLLRSVVLYGGALVLAVGFYRAPPGRLLVDRGKLALPFFGPIERNLGVQRFFHVLQMLYCTGGLRVEHMLRVASRAVTNTALKQDLLRAVPVIERGGTISEALSRPDALDPECKDLVRAGDESGSLEQAFDRIVCLTAEAIEIRLMLFNQVFYRFFLPLLLFPLAMSAASLFRVIFSAS